MRLYLRNMLLAPAVMNEGFHGRNPTGIIQNERGAEGGGKWAENYEEEMKWE